MISIGQLRKLDWRVLVAVGALIAFSWPYMKSASYRSQPDGKGYYTSSPEKQLVWVAAGLVVGLILLVPSYRSLSEGAWVLYAFGLAMLGVVMVFGRTVNGAKSWLVLPAGVRFQPSELVKITTLLALARYLGEDRKAQRFGAVVGALVIAALPCAVIAAQPDLGTALMFVPATVAMLFVAGARLKHLAMLAALSVVLLPVAWFGMSHQQRTRITTWLRQGRTLTQAEQVGEFHHLIQSKVAIGSGGWTGKGIGEGTQNRLNYLGFRNTDFIFAVICEEGGFLAANVIIGLYLLVAYTGLSIAHRCREPVGRLVAVGIVTLLVAQGFVNIAMTVGLLPIVGVTLPFVSYGGSSTVTSFIGISLLLNIGLRRPRFTFAREELSAFAAYYY